MSNLDSINVGDRRSSFDRASDAFDAISPVGQAVVNTATADIKEESDFYYVNQKIQNVAAVASLVIGSTSEATSAIAYGRMDFENDAYLNQIGMGTGGQAQQAFNNYANSITFESHSSPQIERIYVEDTYVNIGAEKITSGDLSSISSTGTMTYGGVTYGASVQSDGSVQLNPNSCGGFFTTPSESAATTIQLDPLQGMANVSSTVNYTSLNGAEKASLDATGSFNRGGITYQGAKTNDGFVNVSASVAYNSPSYNNMCAQFNTPFKATNYEMKASSLNGNQLADIAKNGTYDLGGMKFSIVPNYTKGMETVTAEGFTANYNALSAKAANESASHRSSIAAFNNRDKAATIASIQNAGIQAIRQTGMTNFNGSNWRACLSQTNHAINSLQARQASMDPKAFAEQMAVLTNRKNLIEGYASHGGRIHNPTNNSRAQGRRLVAQYMIGSDMMFGVDFVRNSARVTALAYRATTGLAVNMAYLGSTAANKIVQGGIGRIAGKDSTLYKGLGRVQDRKRDLYQGRKDRIRANRGGRKTRRDFRAQRRDARFNRRTDRLTNRLTRAQASGNTRLAQRIQNRINRLSSFSTFKTNLNKRLNSIRTRIFDNRLMRTIKLPFKAFNTVKAVFNQIKKFFLKIIIVVVIAYVLFVGATCAVLYFSYLVPKFLADISLPSDLYARLNDVNYMQLIVTTTEEDIVQDLQLICQIDATNHYLSKKQAPSTIEQKDGSYKHYPWYMASNFGQIEHVWAWEEADNTSKYAKEDDELSYDTDNNDPTLKGCSGDLIYANENIPQGENGNTYLPQAERTEIGDIEANLVPILTMCHHRYYDNINFETWPTALGYVYYMYSISHDIARYDSDAEYNREQYGDTIDQEGYDYRIEQPHANQVNLYSGEGIQWDPETHELTRDSENCNNIYIHDFDKEDYENKVTSIALKHDSKLAGGVGKTVRQVADAANKLWGWLTGDEYQAADNLDKGYTLANDGLTLNLRKVALKSVRSQSDADSTLNLSIEAIANTAHLDIHKNKSGIFMYDGTEKSLPHSQHEAAQYDTKTWTEYEEEVFNQTCDNVLYFPYGVTSDDGMSNSDTYDARLIPGEDDGAGAISGCHDHCWEDGCYKLTCTEPESEGHWEDANGNDTYQDFPDAQWKEGHTHGAGCYDFTQFECAHGKAYQSEGGHAPWVSESDHGCWKTVAICGGHCGGHITPLVNIVQKMTYEGLAQDDNFRTPYWLQKEEIVNSAGYQYSSIYTMLDTIIGNNIVSVGQFRAYWKLKCNSWFLPIPRSPFTFYKTIGKNMIANFCKAWDGFADAFNNFWSGLFGGGGESDEEDDDKFAVSDEEWTSEDQDTEDLWGWSGWWLDHDQIDTMLVSEMEDFGGSWYLDKYETGRGNWAEWDVQFGRCGVSLTAYTEAEIEELMSFIEANCGPLNDSQKEILRMALSRCGTFGYSLTGSAHINGLNGDSGMADCSGWVSGTLNKALGTDYNTNAAGYANMGTYNGTKVPGSVIAHKNGGNGYSGHVMIYVGYLPAGSQGEKGYYVMDCTSGQVGGSSLRKVSETYLARYTYSWNPW